MKNGSEMRDRIREKLAGVVRDGATSEALVVYFLVEVRKLMDRESVPAADYPSLRLYSNWVMHVELTNRQAQELVEKADAFYQKLKAGELPEEEKADFREVFNFTAFCNELTHFLSANRLPDFDDRWWNAFLTHFLNVVEDCPLVCKAQEERVGQRTMPAREPLLAVDEVVVFLAPRADAVPDGAPPPINWALCHKGQLIFSMSANSALSDEVVDAMVAFGKSRERKLSALDPPLERS